jgi:hypothetical protein
MNDIEPGFRALAIKAVVTDILMCERTGEPFRKYATEFSIYIDCTFPDSDDWRLVSSWVRGGGSESYRV